MHENQGQRLGAMHAKYVYWDEFFSPHPRILTNLL